MTGTPDFDELVGGADLDPAERARLRSVHDLLVSAGPPPEVAPTLLSAVPHTPTLRSFALRYRRTLALAGAVVAFALFGVGYLVGNAHGPDAAFTVAMRGLSGERAQLVVYEKDAAGNWPMQLRLSTVTLRAGQIYELWLTKKGKPEVPCGSFLAVPGRTSIPLNAPYKLRDYDGWVVVPQGSQRAVLWTAATSA